MTNLAKVKVNRFQTGPRPIYDQYTVHVEGKILNNSQVIAFTRNHTDDADDDDDDYGTK